MKTYKTINPTSGAIKHLALGLAATAAFLTTGAMPAHGQLIAPVAATAQSWYADDDRAPGHAIDGSGMTPGSPVTTTSTCGTGPGGNMWLSNGNQDTWITFDLGSVQTIAGFHLWNYNENSSPGEYQRGVKTAGIYAGTSLPANGSPYAEAGPNWVGGALVQNMTLTMAPGTARYAGEDYFLTTPVTTRYLQIYVTSNYGFDDYTGISEIRFIPAARIRSFGTNIDGSSAVIGQVVDGEATIDWTLPYDPYGKPGGAVLIGGLSPTYTLSSGTCTQPNDGVTPPFPGFGAGSVSYTVTDTSTTPPIANLYTVYATVADASTACDITAFDANLPGSKAAITTIDETTGTVVVHVPYGTTEGELAALEPSYTLSTFATCPQPNPGVPSPALSLTTPVHYIVTAQDGTTTKDYTVTVVVSLEPPAGVNGLALWLDAAKITGLANGDTVETWADMSGQLNDAVRANGAPTYQTSVINGQPVVRFYSDAGVGDYFRFPRINTIRTVFWVLKEDVVHTSERALFLLGDSDAYHFHRGGDALWAAGAADGNITGGTTRLMGAVVNGTTTPLPRGSFQMVSLVTTGNVQANQLTQDRIFHGSWKGDIAEVLIYSRALTAQEESAVGKYLATKYGLVTSYTAATMLSFGTNVTGSSAVIDQTAKAIAWTLPYDPYGKPGGAALIAALAPSYTVSSGTGDKDNGGPTTYNFSGPVTYTVTDDLGDADPLNDVVNTYTVTATVAPPSAACDITAFNAGLATTITTTSETTGTVVVQVPYGTTPVQVAALAPTYTLSAGAMCPQPNPGVPSPALSLTTPVHYLVTAQSGATKDYTVTVVVSPWARYAWTGDADSGITSASPYTVAVNFSGSVGSAVTVNGVYFEDSVASGANFSIAGDIAGWGPDGAPNVTGGSLALANCFVYGGNPRTVNLTNLTPGATYETSLFAFGFDAAPAPRKQTFAAAGDSIVLDQNFYGQNNGIRIACTFVADSSGTKELAITPVDAGTTFHLSALANRMVAGPPSSYPAWQAANSTTGTPAEDHDGDGVDNGIEWFVAGSNNSTGFTALPGVDKDPVTGALSVTWTKDAGYTGTYGTDFVVETSDSLTGAWNPEASPGTVTLTGNEVKFTFPSPLGSKKFARLKVTGP